MPGHLGVANEMIFWSKLRHPNVLSFMGFLLENGYHAFVCQWMDGGSLQQRIESGKQSRKDLHSHSGISAI